MSIDNNRQRLIRNTTKELFLNDIINFVITLVKLNNITDFRIKVNFFEIIFSKLKYNRHLISIHTKLVSLSLKFRSINKACAFNTRPKHLTTLRTRFAVNVGYGLFWTNLEYEDLGLNDVSC